MDQIFGNPIDVEQSSPEVDAVFSTTPTEGQGDSTQKGNNDPDTTGQSTDKPIDNNQKGDMLLGKFKDVDALSDAYINIMENKLGREIEQFDTVEELQEAYKQAERELGSRSSAKNVDNPQGQQTQQVTPPANNQYQQLQQAYYQQQAQLQQAMQYLNMLQNQNAQVQQQQQGLYPNQQQPLQPSNNQNLGQSNVVQQQPQEQVDPQKLLDEFYENPAEAIAKLVNPLVDQKTGNIKQQYEQQYQQLMQQYIQPMQAEVAKRQTLDNWERQISELERNIPDFKDYANDIMPEIQKDRNLVQLLNSNPNAMQLVVRTAYDRAKANKLQQAQFQAQQQVQQQQNINQKKSARITSGGAKRVLRQQSQTEKELENIFGNSNKKQGIFG